MTQSRVCGLLPAPVPRGQGRLRLLALCCCPKTGWICPKTGWTKLQFDVFSLNSVGLAQNWLKLAQKRLLITQNLSSTVLFPFGCVLVPNQLKTTQNWTSIVLSVLWHILAQNRLHFAQNWLKFAQNWSLVHFPLLMRHVLGQNSFVMNGN